jgi:hypothetical protein
VPTALLSDLTDFVLQLQRDGRTPEEIRLQAEDRLQQFYATRRKDTTMETPPSPPPDEDYISVSCDTGAHERCRLGPRDLRPCVCWCHKKPEKK